MDKRYIFIIIIFVVCISLILLLEKNNKKENSSEVTNSAEIGVEKIEVNVEEYKKALKEKLLEIEKDYKESGETQRINYYNSSDINEETEENIEIVGLNDIDYKLEKYNSKLEKIEELEEVRYKNKVVELSKKYKIENEKYYLVRYQKDDKSNIIVYFVGKMTDNGFEDLELYCLTL